MTSLQQCIVQIVLTAIFAATTVAAMIFNWPTVAVVMVVLIFLVLSGPAFRNT